MFKPYGDLVREIMDRGFTETNERTGSRIRMSPFPTGFHVDLRHLRLPLPGNRRVYPKTAAAELAWFLSGEKRLDWLRRHCKIWDLFQEEDGTVESAYGYRWRRHFGRDQIGLAVQALRTNSTDRRVFVSAWDPAADGLGAPSRNVPCPVGFTLSVVEGHLNSLLVIRSSDVFVGLPYDVMGHALLMDAVARSVGLDGLAFMFVTLGHPHIYEKHWDMAREGLKKTWAEKPSLPGWSVEEIVRDPDGYVERVRELQETVRWPEFSPRPEVIA
jgi:thymidylate synthase